MVHKTVIPMPHAKAIVFLSGSGR